MISWNSQGSRKIQSHVLSRCGRRKVKSDRAQTVSVLGIQARVTSIHRRQGMLNHSIFFTLDSLKCPLGYTPLVGHVVNVVMVQSIRPNYSWRAISMSPVKRL
ncbi:Cancer/testis antigen 55 [Lemmus lemmus]